MDDKELGEILQVMFNSTRPVEALAKAKRRIVALNEADKRRAVLEARINEVESIFEWGYPSSAYTGIATHEKTLNDSGSLEDRVGYLKSQLSKEDVNE